MERKQPANIEIMQEDALKSHILCNGMGEQTTNEYDDKKVALFFLLFYFMGSNSAQTVRK